MHHKTDVRLVDAHTKGNRRDHDLNVITLKRLLNVSTLISVHPCMIARRTDVVVAQLLRHHFDFLTATTVNDAAIALLGVEITNDLRNRLMLLDQVVANIRTVKTA